MPTDITLNSLTATIPALGDNANIVTAFTDYHTDIAPAVAVLARTNTFTQNNTFSGDIAVNGGDITSTASTLNIGQTATTATTINLGTAATAISTTKTLNLGTGGATGSTTNITLGAGTTSQSSTINLNGKVVFQSGLAGTVAAGVIERDTKLFYSTPNTTTGRGVSPSTHYYVLPSDRLLSSSTSAQSIFNVGLPLVASTAYQYEMVIQFDYVPGGTTITVSDLFAYTGTLTSATATHQYSFNTTSYATGAAANHKFTSTITTGQSVASGSSATVYSVYTKRGIIITNASGTLTPQVQLNVTTGLVTPPTIRANSYIKITPIGAASSTISVGTWA